MHLDFKDDTPPTAKCREIDQMLEQFVSVFSDSLNPEAARLGEDDVAAAIQSTYQLEWAAIASTHQAEDDDGGIE